MYVCVQCEYNKYTKAKTKNVSIEYHFDYSVNRPEDQLNPLNFAKRQHK